MIRLQSFVCNLCLLCIVIYFTQVSAEISPNSNSEVITPPEYRRSTEQTFLTYPEWFLVHSPAEYALFIKNHPANDFPYFGHIKQFWQGYSAVYNATKNDYPVNIGYHIMVMVIGISTTVEYAIKSLYETFIGRISLLTRSHGMTEDEIYAAKVAQDYVDFIRIIPWYEYNFANKLKHLWLNTSLLGPDMIRKWERKYALTTEYSIKAVYAIIIKKLTHMGYETPSPVTAVVLDQLPPFPKDKLPDLNVLEESANGPVLITVPRYDAFKKYATTLAKEGANFIEIAGNRSIILVSLLTPEEWLPENNAGDILLTQPILTQPGTKRIILVIPIISLASELNKIRLVSDIKIEHIYDF